MIESWDKGKNVGHSLRLITQGTHDSIEVSVFTTHRKIRLFQCAVARQYINEITDPRCLKAIDIGEKSALGLVNDLRRQQQWRTADAGCDPSRGGDCCKANILATRCVANNPIFDSPLYYDESHMQILQDILGNPFRKIEIHNHWKTSLIMTTILTMYRERNYTEMPILADMLEDVGCQNEFILNHLRSKNPHYLGCWVLDLFLNRK